MRDLEPGGMTEKMQFTLDAQDSAEILDRCAARFTNTINFSGSLMGVCPTCLTADQHAPGCSLAEVNIADWPMVHALAYVQSSEVGARTKVWQFATIIRGSIIGDNCNIGACSVVDAAKIGNGCSVGHGAQLHPGTNAGNEVFFGPGCIVCNDPWPRVRKGDFDIEKILKGFVTVKIESNASLGAGSIVLPGITIGAGAMIAAGAIVTCSVPAGHLYKRDGDIIEIGRRQITRMRAAPAV
jgi:UDP-2-acetamido-3-amino-2,3-dideoxy-glucuronate N-acetyltransferase